MHTFLDNFHQGRKYSTWIASRKVELRREEKSTDQTSFNISSLQTDYLNLETAQVVIETVKEQTMLRQSAIFVEVLTTL